jgi:hypothetical protein
MSDVLKFPTKDDDYKGFIGVLIKQDNSIELSLPEGYSKAELIGMLNMAALMVMDHI